MIYTYVLKSLKDGRFYTGTTNDLRKRFSQHNKGQVPSTKLRLPFELIYYEACVNENDAYVREKFLKTGMGKRYLNNRLKRFLSLTGQVNSKEKSAAGFTLIEILVTMGIFAVLLSLGLLFGIDFYKAYAFNSERQLVVGILQKARSRSLANINQSEYGVCINGSNYIIFSGSVSCDPNNSANEVYTAHPGISNTGLSVSFAQLSGRPTPANSSLTLQYDQRTAVININSEGRVDW